MVGYRSPLTRFPLSITNTHLLPTVKEMCFGEFDEGGLETVGVGEITYECRDKANMPGQTEWVFVGPKAVLNDRSGKQVGTYYGPPATWESNDGSKLTATQLAVAPSGTGNLPYQLVKANPAMGSGAMTGVTFIQRVALKGGVAPAAACTTANKGERQIVKYQADYIFWKAA